MSELTLRVRNEKPMIVRVTEVKPKNHNVIGSEKQLPSPEYSVSSSSSSKRLNSNYGNYLTKKEIIIANKT